MFPEVRVNVPGTVTLRLKVTPALLFMVMLPRLESELPPMVWAEVPLKIQLVLGRAILPLLVSAPLMFNVE